MAIEDAACLGIVFGKQHFEGDIRKALELYEQIRKPRATRVQAASARARENIHERIGKKAFRAWDHCKVQKVMLTLMYRIL